MSDRVQVRKSVGAKQLDTKEKTKGKKSAFRRKR